MNRRNKISIEIKIIEGNNNILISSLYSNDAINLVTRHEVTMDSQVLTLKLSEKLKQSDKKYKTQNKFWPSQNQ